jgi:hypothetical protein
MIDFDTIEVGDRVKVVGQGARGFAVMGEVLEVIGVGIRRVETKRADGKVASFDEAGGAARLELVEG